MPITLQEAQRIVEWVIAEAGSQEKRIGVAVVNDRAGTVCMSSMDGTRPFTVDTARGKAMATALWGRSGASLAGREASSVFQLVGHLYGDRVVYAEGSALLKRGDETVGAVGVSGAAPAEDEALAQAVADAFAAGKLDG